VSTIAGRFRQATLVVAIVGSFVFAATAALIAVSLWETREVQLLRDTSRALEEAIEGEAAEQGGPLPQAAREAFRETGLVTHRAEVWHGSTLLASSQAGRAVGPLPANDLPTATPDWIALARPLGPDLTLLVAAPRDLSSRAFGVFGWSLLLASPIGVGIALLVGRRLGHRVARPVSTFRDRIAGALPLRPLSAAKPEDLEEVRDLEQAFSALWDRLNESLAREQDFAANASHELRTPLTRLSLLAERALSDAGPDASEALRLQMEEVSRLTRLVDALLLLARDPAARLEGREAVNISDLVRSSAHRILKTRTLALDAPDEALVRGEEDLLVIAIDNLLENAGKFASVGEAIPISVLEHDGRVRLAITTPGARIAPGEREQLFERFYRGPEARAAGPGYGLGLPLARHIARLHGGDVVCAGGDGVDARFVLEAPAWRPVSA